MAVKQGFIKVVVRVTIVEVPPLEVVPKIEKVYGLPAISAKLFVFIAILMFPEPSTPLYVMNEGNVTPIV